MDQLESQVAKIQIDSGKNASSYVLVLAEKAQAGSSELYAVIELPLFNPAAESACESICLAITSALKRAYKKIVGDNIFESAVAQINEELSKLVESGNSGWINKMNAILAVKDGADFSIATCGKTAAYLFRNEEFTDISCSPAKTNPLKTFENLAFGKLKLNDIIILSTTQLFNYLAIDRLKATLLENDFLTASKTVVDILKQNAGPEVAFGAILNLQVLPGQTQNEEIDLEEYAAVATAGPSVFQKFFANFNFRMPQFKMPAITFPKLSVSGSIGGIKKMASSGKGMLAETKNYSRTKKIFFISVIVLIIAFILDVSIAAHYKKTAQTQSQISTQLKSAQTLLESAKASLLYKDYATAKTDILKAQDQIPGVSDVSKNDQALYTDVTTQLNTLKQSLENTVTAQVTNLGSLGAGNSLLSLNNFLATQVNTTILSYNKTTSAIQDSALLSSQKLLAAAYIKNSLAVVYNGSSLLTWDFSAKQFSTPFVSSVPDENSFVNLKYYATNSRVYTINKSTNQIVNFAVAAAGVSKPVVASKPGNDFSKTLDFAIDGSIYTLTPGSINKYSSGSPAAFTTPTLITPLGDKGKINTQINWKNLYVLDAANNRIVVIDKKGALVEILKSPDFTNLKDFVVDEPGKVAYILNDSNLLKVTLP